MCFNSNDLIRKIYHDGVNFLNPIREIIKLRFLNDEITMQMCYNISVCLDLLCNSRIMVFLDKFDEKSQKEVFPLCKSFKSVNSDLMNNYLVNKEFLTIDDSDGKMKNISISTNKRLFDTLLYNLMVNAYRHGRSMEINISDNLIIIRNELINIGERYSSVFEFPVKTDRFGVSGSGLGLKVVRRIAEKLGIKITSSIAKKNISVTINYDHIVV
ncbi:ATP-binding protein [Deferribacter abyssi]|uniref:ATP-binding protein n=1 Tax=Deferribacter abyssi TaxID=213806 RepID=UPI003C135945